MHRIPILFTATLITATLIFSACGPGSGDFSKIDRQAKDLYAFTQGLTEDGTRLGNMIFDTVDGKTANGDAARKELVRLRRKCRDKAREVATPVQEDFAAYKKWRAVVVSYLTWEAEGAADFILKAIAASEDTTLSQAARREKILKILEEMNPVELQGKSDVEEATQRLYKSMNERSR